MFNYLGVTSTNEENPRIEERTAKDRSSAKGNICIGSLNNVMLKNLPSSHLAYSFAWRIVIEIKPKGTKSNMEKANIKETIWWNGRGWRERREREEGGGRDMGRRRGRKRRGG